MNVKSHNNISKWQVGFNSAFKGLILAAVKYTSLTLEMFLSHSLNFVRFLL
jgi:hypothetical protein